MDFHNQLMAFTVILLSAQNFALAGEGILTYKQLTLKVANADMVPADQVTKIVNVRDLLLRKAKFATDCDELFEQGFNTSGLYVIKPEPVAKMPPIVVNCHMNYDCSGWTVLHQNSKQSEMTWNETWTTYKYGFGNIQGDHYIGNKYMHFLTTQKWYKARVVLDDVNHNQSYAEYDIFRLGNEMTHYRLHLGAYKGGAGDALAISQNMVDNSPFSSRDNDRDGDVDNCASKYGGGWWYDTCPTRNPFAMLTQKENIHWKPFCNNCKHVVLMVKPINMFCRSEGMKEVK